MKLVLFSWLVSKLLKESPTLQMYLAIQTNNLPKLKEAIEKGAVLENEFQSYRLMDMNGLRDRDGEAENRNPVKNPLEYALGKKICFEIKIYGFFSRLCHLEFTSRSGSKL